MKSLKRRGPYSENAECDIILTQREDELVMVLVGDEPQQDRQKKRQNPENKIVDSKHIHQSLERITEVVLRYP